MRTLKVIIAVMIIAAISLFVNIAVNNSVKAEVIEVHSENNIDEAHEYLIVQTYHNDNGVLTTTTYSVDVRTVISYNNKEHYVMIDTTKYEPLFRSTTLIRE
jgi:Na+-translocating ferredoxin:NAD+ oxidoreductase RnfG subunit